MKKKILSQLMILSFAFAGLFLVGNNVFADSSSEHDADDEAGGGSGSTTKCMVSGGGLWASAYRCDDPGYPSLPQYKCGTPFWPRTGRKLVQCFK